MTSMLRSFLIVAVVGSGSASLRSNAAPPSTDSFHQTALPGDARHRLCIPRGFKATGETVDVLVHFHGSARSVAESCQTAGLNCVVVGVSYAGLSSVYRKPFSADRQLFQQVLDEALAELRAQPEYADSTTWGTIGVSSFSAGFGAIREILKSDKYFQRIDAVYLADSLYSGYVGDGTSNIESGVVHPGLMKDFLRYAKASAAGNKVMIVTHCNGPTPGYASTRETADYLLKNLELQAESIERKIELPSVSPPKNGNFQLSRQANRGGFWLYGTPGDNVEDHVQHFRHMGYWLALLPLEK